MGPSSPPTWAAGKEGGGRLGGRYQAAQSWESADDGPVRTLSPPPPSNTYRTVDVGIPQLSMHSIREMCGTDDVDIAYNHFVAFFEVWGQRGGCLEDPPLEGSALLSIGPAPPAGPHPSPPQDFFCLDGLIWMWTACPRPTAALPPPPPANTGLLPPRRPPRCGQPAPAQPAGGARGRPLQPRAWWWPATSQCAPQLGGNRGARASRTATTCMAVAGRWSVCPPIRRQQGSGRTATTCMVVAGH